VTTTVSRSRRRIVGGTNLPRTGKAHRTRRQPQRGEVGDF
jgi:hypothetical protein